MIPTLEALKDWKKDELGCYSIDLGYGLEIMLEPLIFDEQWYLAIYQNKSLIAPKVVVKLGKAEDYL